MHAQAYPLWASSWWVKEEVGGAGGAGQEVQLAGQEEQFAGRMLCELGMGLHWLAEACSAWSSERSPST